VHRRTALLVRLGWLDGQPRSLQEAGDLAGVTRERMRQIQVRFEERAPTNIPVAPVERALDLVRAAIPTTVRVVEELLLEEGITERGVHPEGLIRFARFLGLTPGFEVMRFGSFGEVVVPSEVAPKADLLARLRQEVRRQSRPYGFVHEDQVREVLHGLGPELGRARMIPLMMSAVGAAPVADGWFYLKADARDPTVRLLLDMLAVAGGVISASEAREGFERRLRWRSSAGHVTWRGWCPSEEALLGFARSRPDLFRVMGADIEAVEPLDWRSRLSGAERIVVEVLYETPGRVLTRDAFEQEVIRRGVNQNTFGVYSSYSPFIRDLGGGLWAIRGVEPDPIQVEHLRRRPRDRQRRIEGWQWLPTEALRLLIRVGRIGNFVVGIPAVARPYLAGRDFQAVLACGDPRGRIRIDEQGASWGWGPPLKRLGARKGDLVAADFDLPTGTVKLSLEREAGDGEEVNDA
jgi:hypothetical protein